LHKTLSSSLFHSPVVAPYGLIENYFMERRVDFVRTSAVAGRLRSVASKLSNDRLIGRAQVILSAIGFGTIGASSKLAYASGIDAGALLALRFIVAAVALWAYFLIFNRKGIRVARKELAICAALGLAGYGIFSNLIFKAFETTPSSIVGLLFFSYPIFVIMLDWLVSKERPDAQLWIGSLMIICGISVGVFGTLTGGFEVGLLLAVAGAAWYAAYVVATRRLLVNLKPQTVALYVTTFAALGFWMMGGPVISHLHLASGQTVLIVLWIGLVSTVMAMLSFYSGLDKLGSAEASQVGTFELIVSLTLAAFLLGEHVGLSVILGATFIFAGIVTGQIKSSNQTAECGDDLPC
jgi:drug/metabolite transporter (DMT)-like permease